MEKFIRKYGVILVLYFVIFCGILMLNARCRYLNEQGIGGEYSISDSSEN